MHNLTNTQRQVLDYLHELAEYNELPHLNRAAELTADHLHITTDAAEEHLRALGEAGYITIPAGDEPIALAEPKQGAGFEPITDIEYERKPLLGEVAAGTPLVYYQQHVELVDLPRLARIPSEAFLLKVKGDSLHDAYIRSGDIVIVNPAYDQAELPAKKPLVVAVIDDSTTVKRYIPNEDGIELKPENKEYDSIYVKGDEPGFRIVGVVVGIYRKYV